MTNRMLKQVAFRMADKYQPENGLARQMFLDRIMNGFCGYTMEKQVEGKLSKDVLNNTRNRINQARFCLESESNAHSMAIALGYLIYERGEK